MLLTTAKWFLQNAEFWFIYLLIFYELCDSLIRCNTWAQFSCCIPHFQLKEKKKQAKKEGKDKIEEEEDPEKVLYQEIMAGETTFICAGNHLYRNSNTEIGEKMLKETTWGLMFLFPWAF